MTETGETADRPEPAPEDQHEAQHHLARRRHLARLRGLAGRLDHQAALIRNGGRDPRAEARAGKLADESFAIRWALRRIAPETECVRQTLDALHGTGITARSQP
jgi:hypothetical protein